MKKIIFAFVVTDVMLVTFGIFGSQYLYRQSYQTGYRAGLKSGTKMGRDSGYTAGVADGRLNKMLDDMDQRRDREAKTNSKKITDHIVGQVQRQLMTREPEATLQRILDSMTPLRKALEKPIESSLLPLSNSERTEDRIKFIDWAEKEYGTQSTTQH